MKSIKAIDLDGNEIIIENPREITQSMGDVRPLYERCGFNWFFNYLVQCPDCKGVESKSCGKMFPVATVRSEPELIEIDGKQVREILKIIP